MAQCDPLEIDLLLDTTPSSPSVFQLLMHSSDSSDATAESLPHNEVLAICAEIKAVTSVGWQLHVKALTGVGLRSAEPRLRRRSPSVTG